MRVAVTGASGFIGRHLLPRLAADGHDLTVLLREEKPPFPLPPRAEAVAGDVTDPASLAPLAGADVLVHMAAVSFVPHATRDPHHAYRVNVEGTLHALEAARRAERPPRVVLMSSAYVYGPPRRVPVDEEHPLAPTTVYGATKLAAESLAMAYHREFRLPVVVVRPFNVYGPGQSRDFLVPTVVEQALAGGEVRLGDLEAVRDYTFVDDFVDFLVRAMREPAAVGEALNVGSGEGRSVREVVEAVGRALGRELRVVTERSRLRPSETPRIVVDASKAQRLLGWRASTPFEEGVRAVVSRARG